MKHFSNRYMMLYALALAAVVALILTVVASALKERQQSNHQAETQQMILKTIGIEASRNDAPALFAKHISEQTLGENIYYLFDGGIILPMNGNGLWGPIWGYLALDESGTVVGAVFDHSGETPGLGGEIATDAFAARFVGKKMDIKPIRLIKNADKNNAYEVDAISGSTMTSNGVTEMLSLCYNQYELLLQ